MSAAVFRSNDKNFVNFMSTFVSKLDFLTHFRVEQFLTIFGFNQVAIFLTKLNSVLNVEIYPVTGVILGVSGGPCGASWRQEGAKKEPAWLLLEPVEGKVSMGRDPGGCRRIPHGMNMVSSGWPP